MHTIDPVQLKQARIAAGLTQTQTGELVGATKKSVSHYETGRAKPSADGLLNYLLVFKLRPADVAKKI